MALFSVISRQLGYQWVTPGQDLVIRDLMDEGIAFLQRYDYTVSRSTAETDFFVRGLLVEYIRYALSNARDDFTVNYRKELLSLADRGRKKRAEAKDQESE